MHADVKIMACIVFVVVLRSRVSLNVLFYTTQLSDNPAASHTKN